ncbi:MAG: UbiA family prenyltransferase [Candidatus Thermoplasmatota archaeon]|nr:UbiA family prenyltransferase [Candidatus Thermoplasmatota archaeon]
MNRYLSLMRPINAIMASLGTLIGGIVGLRSIHALEYPKLYLSMVAVFFVLMAGNIINDYFDLETDKINHPNRPLPSGKISKNSAGFMAIAFFMIGIIISFFLANILQILIVLIAIGMLVLYEWRAKAIGLIGNVIISFLVGLVFIFGSLTLRFSNVVILLALMAMMANLSREIVKDVEDVGGDVNRVTLPKRIGKNLSLVASSIFIIGAVSISPIPYLFYGWEGSYLAIVAISDVVFGLAAVYSFINPTKGQNYIKYAMIIGLMAFLVGGIL